jgi:hypothetical protein
MASSQVRAPVAPFAHATNALALPVAAAMKATAAVETSSGGMKACAETRPRMESKFPHVTIMVETVVVSASS